MIALLILLISGGSMMICANRLKFFPGLGVVPRTITGPTMYPQHRGPVPLNPFRLHHPRMQQVADPEEDDDIDRADESTRDAEADTEAAVATWGWKAKTSMDGRRPISQQKFPPFVIYSMDARRVLYSWADAFVDPSTPGAGSPQVSWFTSTPGAGAEISPKYVKADSRKVLGRMRLVVEEATEIYLQIKDLSLYDLEMVGLIPKDYEIPFDEKGSAEKSLLALGVFSREEVQDDSLGSLRKKLEDNYGKEYGTWAGRAENPLEAFAIEGIADAPGLGDRSARILLSKIEKYARKEQRMIVVPLRAYNSKDDGTDLTDYYVRLGFEKVEVEGRKYKLVYTGHSISEADEWVETQQICAGLNLWQGFS